MFKWWIINDQVAIGSCALVLQFPISGLEKLQTEATESRDQTTAWITHQLMRGVAPFFGFIGPGRVRYEFLNIQMWWFGDLRVLTVVYDAISSTDQFWCVNPWLNQ